MNYSPAFVDLIQAISNYIEASSKTNYRFTIEEQFELERKIKVLENQLKILTDYEIEKLKKEN